MAQMVAIRTTRYPLILMLFCDVEFDRSGQVFRRIANKICPG